jgi:hypothetical protein
MDHQCGVATALVKDGFKIRQMIILYNSPHPYFLAVLVDARNPYIRVRWYKYDCTLPESLIFSSVRHLYQKQKGMPKK